MDSFRLAALAVAACLGTFLSTLDISIVHVALPTLQRAWQADLSMLQWVVDAYALALSSLMLAAGPLADRFGDKSTWLAGILLFIGGSAVCVVAPALGGLLGGRALQGIGGALLVPGAMPLLTRAFVAPRARARVIGAWSATSALGLIAGPLAGGWLIETWGWHSIFSINIPIGLLAAVLGAWGMTSPSRRKGVALPTGALACSVVSLGTLSAGLIALGDHPVGAVQVAGPIALAALAAVALVVIERRSALPWLPRDLWRAGDLGRAQAGSFILGFSAYSSLFFLSLFLQQVRGDSPPEAGTHLAPEFVAMAVASLTFGRLSHALSVRGVMVAGHVLIGTGLWGAAAMGYFTAWSWWTTDLVVLGLGAGWAVPATGLFIMSRVTPERGPMASALMNTLRQTGMTVGIALLGSLMSRVAVHHLAAAMSATGIPDAAAFARDAVLSHRLSGLPGDAHRLYRDAVSSGFSAVMACAGCISLAAAGFIRRSGSPSITAP